tara:strand:+ start:3021 stop:4034 length:1014 start_codon:yes stop_codon:yes gene_type:complete
VKYKNTKYLLNKHPVGMPGDDCWIIDYETISNILPGELIIKNEYLSIDPYMRGRMNQGVSYASALNVGDVMVGETVGTVVESRSNLYQVGDKICANCGWTTFTKTKDTNPALIKVPSNNLTLSSFLGALGMPGRTAFFGINIFGQPKKDETLVVSAASGAVGSIVGQLGKIFGCHVVGVAGGPEKCAYVKDVLNFDDCVDYKSYSFAKDLKESCKKGIDIYFENVGGDVTKEVSKLLNPKSRVPICGYISKYNEKDLLNTETPFHIFGKLNPKPSHRFFVVTEWANQWEAATKELLELVNDNKIFYRETITDGFENAPQALRDVLSGKNFGKQIIKI